MGLMAFRLVALLSILLIPGALIFCALLFPLSAAWMIIRVGNKRTVARTIEWADAKRKNPVCFILKCPHCREEQWVRKDALYRSTNGTLNNHKCISCGKGAERRKLWADRQKEQKAKMDLFQPRNPGWKSTR
jgi:hypothetical protein